MTLYLLINFFISNATGLNMNLSNIFEASPIYDDTLNVTLDDNNSSYYLNNSLEFIYDKFSFIGNENIIYLVAQTQNAGIFSFKTNKKTYFSGLSFVFEGNSQIQESIFSFENVDSIVFQVNIYFYFMFLVIN